MSTLAIWLFVLLGFLLVLAVLLVVFAARSTYRRGRVLAKEVALLGDDVDRLVARADQQIDHRTHGMPD
jgi:uncharacterized membrane protein